MNKFIIGICLGISLGIFLGDYLSEITIEKKGTWRKVFTSTTYKCEIKQ